MLFLTLKEREKRLKDNNEKLDELTAKITEPTQHQCCKNKECSICKAEKLLKEAQGI